MNSIKHAITDGATIPPMKIVSYSQYKGIPRREAAMQR
jgi:hypothetical protein